MVFLSAVFAPKKAISQVVPIFTAQDSLRGTLSPLRTCFDVTYYDISLRVIPNEKKISGKNTIHYLVKADFKKIQLDLFENLAIEKILYHNKPLKFTRNGNAFFVNFDDIQKKNKRDSLTIFYAGTPTEAKNAPWDGGFSWKKDNDKNDWIGLSCEGIGASLWFPNKDHLSDEPDNGVRVACEVPSDLICVSNGKLFSTQKLSDNYTRYDWRTSYPINNYNITLNIGKYVHFGDIYMAEDETKLALDYYVMPYNLEKAKKQFEQVKPMLKCFERYFGKYPFWNDGYALVETPYLGMEHQGAIAYGNKYQNGYNGRDLSQSGVGMMFDFIIIHESGHEYWGNNLSAQDHAEMWLHEAFTTYSEVLYVECMFGKAQADTYVNGYKKIVANAKPMLAPLGVNADAPGDIYFKGALMLNTLRNILNNDKLWFEILKGLQKDFSMKTTTTKEVINYINKKAKKDLTYFFDEYLKYAQIPTLEYYFEEDKTNAKTSKGDKILFFRWNSNQKNFAMPLIINNKTISATTNWQSTKIRANNVASTFNALNELLTGYYIKIAETK